MLCFFLFTINTDIWPKIKRFKLPDNYFCFAPFIKAHMHRNLEIFTCDPLKFIQNTDSISVSSGSTLFVYVYVYVCVFMHMYFVYVSYFACVPQVRTLNFRLASPLKLFKLSNHAVLSSSVS